MCLLALGQLLGAKAFLKTLMVRAVVAVAAQGQRGRGEVKTIGNGRWREGWPWVLFREDQAAQVEEYHEQEQGEE